MSCEVCKGAVQLSCRVLRSEKRDQWNRSTIFHEKANYCPRCGRDLRREEPDGIRAQG